MIYNEYFKPKIARERIDKTKYEIDDFKRASFSTQDEYIKEFGHEAETYYVLEDGYISLGTQLVYAPADIDRALQLTNNSTSRWIRSGNLVPPYFTARLQYGKGKRWADVYLFDEVKYILQYLHEYFKNNYALPNHMNDLIIINGRLAHIRQQILKEYIVDEDSTSSETISDRDET